MPKKLALALQLALPALVLITHESCQDQSMRLRTPGARAATGAAAAAQLWRAPAPTSEASCNLNPASPAGPCHPQISTRCAQPATDSPRHTLAHSWQHTRARIRLCSRACHVADAAASTAAVLRLHLL